MSWEHRLVELADEDGAHRPDVLRVAAQLWLQAAQLVQAGAGLVHLEQGVGEGSAQRRGRHG